MKESWRELVYEVKVYPLHFSSLTRTFFHFKGLPDESVDVVIAAQCFHWFAYPLLERFIGYCQQMGGLV